MELDRIGLATPVFFLLIGVEWLYGRRTGRSLYRLNDAFNDLSCGILQQLATLAFAAVMVWGYVTIYDRFALVSLDRSSASVWIACFIGVDFLYYWYHRLAHEINFMWAAHVVHHQSEDYNLAVALRQSSLQPFQSMVFYWPLALIGFPPTVFVSCAAINTLYQFWIHTQAIDRLGFLEAVLMTPSHHRVHHGRNPIYIDRNHGGTFIFWDKLFGTYQREEEEVAYGVTKPLATWNPLWANIDYWVDLIALAGRCQRWIDRVHVFVARPGWRPDDLGGLERPQPVPMPPALYDPPVPTRSKVYASLQFIQLIAWTLPLMALAASLDGTQLALASLGIAWGLVGVGAVLDGRRWAGGNEWARILVTPILCMSILPESTLVFLSLGFYLNLIPAALLGVHPWAVEPALRDFR